MEIISPENITEYHIFDSHCKPLSYSDLISVSIKKEKTLELSLEGALTEDLAIPPPNFRNASINFTIVFNEEFEIFSLVEDGWLPLPFVNPPYFLVDSNVIINLEKIVKNLPNTNPQYASWWLQILNSPEVIINPLLYAFEGKEMKTPTLAKFQQYFEESTSTIKNVLPNANIITFNSESYSAVYEMIGKSEKQIEFLLKVNLLLFNHISKRDLSVVESEILNIAKELKINMTSLVVLVALSCLYEKADNSNYQAARKILKFSPNFNERKAYNVLSDLLALELFVGSGAISNKYDFPKYAFCTSDKSIALFGCGLRLKNKSIGDSGLTCNINLSQELFPALTEIERQELVNRLSTK